MVKQRVRKWLKNGTTKLDRILIGKKEFVIISNNCWGAEIYKRLNREYNTPFVGLFLFGPDYVKLVENFDYYLSLPLKFTTTSQWGNSPVNYPIGKLDDIEIHFMHYASNEDAEVKWTRRLSRMNKIKDKSKYYFKICDRDLATVDLIKRFHETPFANKIPMGINPVDSEGHITIAETNDNVSVPDGLVLYDISFKYVDIFKWIKTGKITNNRYSGFKYSARVS
jgi:uncharacterized protein (DUF1919 family)